MAEVLDTAERGESVVIERQGIRFKIEATGESASRKRVPTLEILDSSVETGDWTWQEGPGGLSFKPRKPR
jgi:hypothetical protein